MLIKSSVIIKLRGVTTKLNIIFFHHANFQGINNQKQVLNNPRWRTTQCFKSKYFKNETRYEKAEKEFLLFLKLFQFKVRMF